MKRCAQGHEYTTGRCEQCRKAYRSKAYRRIPRPIMKCPQCGVVGPVTIDHIVPLAKGGTNDISNLQYLCLSCNVKKGAA